jgi:hypothetical protein
VLCDCIAYACPVSCSLRVRVLSPFRSILSAPADQGMPSEPFRSPLVRFASLAFTAALVYGRPPLSMECRGSFSSLHPLNIALVRSIRREVPLLARASAPHLAPPLTCTRDPCQVPSGLMPRTWSASKRNLLLSLGGIRCIPWVESAAFAAAFVCGSPHSFTMLREPPLPSRATPARPFRAHVRTQAESSRPPCEPRTGGRLQHGLPCRHALAGVYESIESNGV